MRRAIWALTALSSIGLLGLELLLAVTLHSAVQPPSFARKPSSSAYQLLPLGEMPVGSRRR